MKLSIFTLFLFFNISANAGFKIVSDFDDTIKRSHIPEAWYSVLYNSVLYKKAYRGMPSLYRAMEKNSEGLYVLSASPNVVRAPIKGTLNYYSIPYAGLFTRDISELCNKEKYKISKIESVIKNNNDDLILLGDNVEADHIVYMEIAKKNPGRVSDIYIRKVLDSDLPEGINGFFTAFDIAAREFAKGRLSFSQVEDVAQIINTTNSKNMYMVIPNYAFCPMKKESFPQIMSEDKEVIRLGNEIVNKVIKYCKIRTSNRSKRAEISRKLRALRKLKSFLPAREYKKRRKQIIAKRSSDQHSENTQVQAIELEE